MKQEVIAIANQKGGVGKTTTAFNIAAGLVKAGKQVLCIDLDPQANLSEYLGYEPDGKPTITALMTAAIENKEPDTANSVRKNREGIDYIPADIALSGADLFLAGAFMREQILKQIVENQAFSAYDYIIIDCLPSLGILLTNALTASTGVIIPVQTQKFARDGLNTLLTVCKMIKQRINPRLAVKGILLTMTDNTNGSKEIEAELAETFGEMLFTAKIKRAAEAVRSSRQQKSLISQSSSKLGAQYAAVVGELMKE